MDPEAPEDVRQVERILGKREEEKESNVQRFLSDLQLKKHKVLINQILSTNSTEGKELLKTQKQKLMEFRKIYRKQGSMS